MRIAQLSNHYAPCKGGIEGFVQALAELLNKRGIYCTELCLNKCWESEEILKGEEKINNVVVKRMPFLNLRWLKIPRGLLGKIKGFDLVHVHSPGFFIDWLAITKPLHGKKLIVSTHGGIFHSNEIKLLKRLYFRVWWGLMFKAVDFVVCDSQHDFELFRKIAKKGRIKVIENAVPVEKYLALGKKKTKNSFLFVGRLSRNKRIDLMAEVFAKVSEKEKNFKVSVIGRDFEGLSPKLKARVRELGLEKNFAFEGEVPEKRLMQAYGESEFFISTSAYEGFGISAIEGMAAGAIPLLSDIATFNTFVKHGKNGMIIDFAEKEKAAESILKAMQMPEREKQGMRKNGAEKAKEFSWQRKIDEYTEVYRQVLGKRQAIGKWVDT
ncbi:MAG: glycosyltransferase family 4 protein [Candidatus Diapherotrites archaeon]|uniref:Glycosyltransferase family 4 protein n=1 Tax=Candidatus Iainarchaeum sp. TaxID=3101447 RepID=A0A938YP35_9ARCH|nr:glycosyltransferase family 4 protein [Candidatus Diapherotrites archaeon]